VEEIGESDQLGNDQAPGEEDAGEEGEEAAPRGFYLRQNNDGSGGTIIFEGVNPLMTLLTGGAAPFGGRIFGQPVAGSSTSSTGAATVGGARRAPTGNRSEFNNDYLGQFLGQLVANLANQGANQAGNEARLTFHINNDGVGGIFQAFHGHPSDYAWGEGGIDAIVTQLLNQFDGNQAEGVSNEDIARIPMSDVTDKQVENGTQCTTCMETFGKGEKVAQLDCQHIFHKPCIEPWLVRHNTCPICRQVVDPKKWGPEQRITDIDELD